MSKKKALGSDPLSWIRPTIEEKQEEEGRKEASGYFWYLARPAVQEAAERQEAPHSARVPKFETFGVKLTVRLTEDQLYFLSALERTIMKGRGRESRGERITKNSIIRAAINALRRLELDTRDIPDEAELERRVEEAFLKGTLREAKISP
ncbi:MAG: hypothetical protein QXX77_07965 [Candidatus Methanosuratincola sp.]